MLLTHSKSRLCALKYLLAGALLSPSFLSAQSITVASGTLLSLGAGSIDAGCGDLSVAGTFSVGSGSANSLRNVAINSGTINGGSGSINLSGDWTNQGTFNAQTGSVNEKAADSQRDGWSQLFSEGLKKFVENRTRKGT